MFWPAAPLFLLMKGKDIVIPKGHEITVYTNTDYSTKKVADKYWRDQGMVGRWVASAWLLTENRFRIVFGHRDLWALATILGRRTETEILLANVT